MKLNVVFWVTDLFMVEMWEGRRITCTSARGTWGRRIQWYKGMLNMWLIGSLQNCAKSILSNKKVSLVLNTRWYIGNSSLHSYTNLFGSPCAWWEPFNSIFEGVKFNFGWYWVELIFTLKCIDQLNLTKCTQSPNINR